MASTVLCGILADVKQTKYFSFIAAVTTDVSTKEQLCICLRHADINLQVNEDFTGMCETDKTDAQIITVLTKDALICCDLRGNTANVNATNLRRCR